MSSVVPRSTTDRGLSRLLHTELHWRDLHERVKYKLSIMVHYCLNGQASQYLIDFCRSLSAVASRQHLRSTSRQLLGVSVEFVCQTNFSVAFFSVAGPSAYNSLPEYPRDPAIGRHSFRQVALLWQRDRATRLSVEILQLQNIPFEN